MAELAAFRSGWVRPGLRRVHIMRSTPIPHNGDHRSQWMPAGRPAWCGQSSQGTRKAETIPVNPTVPLPEGLEWCAVCVGRAADHAGILPDVMRLLLAAISEEANTGV